MHLIAQSSDTNAIIAVAIIAAGFVLGSIAAAIARRLASSEKRPEAVRSSAGALATLAFSLILIIALVSALGVISSTALEQLSSDVVTFLPRLLSAAIVLIIGNIVGALVETGISRSLGHVSAELRDRVPLIVKYAIMGFAVVIAANQLGVDTTIILVIVASVTFGVALSLALLAGLGGRPIAEQVAAGRALRRDLVVGDTVRFGAIQGQIAAIGSTSTQITGPDDVVLVPNIDLLSSSVEIIETASAPSPDDD